MLRAPAAAGLPFRKAGAVGARVSAPAAGGALGTGWRYCRPLRRTVNPIAAPVRALLLAGGLAGAAAAQAAPSEADNQFFRRAAACVAVLENDAVALAGRYQAGERAVKPALVKLTEQGFSFIGRAYLRGLRKEEADRLTAQAEAAQKTMPADALRQLSSSCQAEGARLYADAGTLEQMIVSNRAKARVDKLLAAKKPPG